jgi:homoaconitate hydratase
MVEEGYAFPGTMVVASDSHANMYGGLGCLGTPLVRTDAAAIWATGRTWWQVPPVAKVVLTGRLQPGVSGKDVIITLCGRFNRDEVLNHALEFTGDGIEHLSIEERLTIANMTTEWGALVGLFPIDETTVAWLHERRRSIAERGPAGVPSDADGGGEHPRLSEKRIGNLEKDAPRPDPDASYSAVVTLDLSTVRPHVSGPNHVKVMTPATELEARNIKINKAYLVSCVNSRLGDLTAAAQVVRGKKVADGVEFYIAAASSEVQTESEKRGDWQALIDAGAKALPPGCGPCIGLGTGLLQDGEVGISATNRNFRGRMGSRFAEAYLASPAVVAASAIAGTIACPASYDAAEPSGTMEIPTRAPKSAEEVVVLRGFPERFEGELVFCYQDNLNTDGIYPGKYTYRDDFQPQQQAEVAMDGYDQEFKALTKQGDILVGGFNFGTGSSREQAVTALKYRGIQLVMGGSFSETYKRNALNNGFLVIEAPELVRDLKGRFGSDKPTVRTDLVAKVDVPTSSLTVDNKTYPIGSIGPAAQELIIEGGLENWVRNRMNP